MRTPSFKQKVLPVLPEPEDRNFISDAALQQVQLLVPQTVSLFATLPNVIAYAYALLQPKAVIAAHRHQNPYVTASFCLACGDDCFIRVNNETRQYKEKEMIVFDYTQTHEVVNNGNTPRLALLMLLPNRN
jgi:aspartyl/asparaginyl beta-hydroxylase (cupin superfamily)